jgi:hypothetical protein
VESGLIHLNNLPLQRDSTPTHDLHNLNENLTMYSAFSAVSNVIALHSICYSCESTGRLFPNARDDLVAYFNAMTCQSSGRAVCFIGCSGATPSA